VGHFLSNSFILLLVNSPIFCTIRWILVAFTILDQRYSFFACKALVSLFEPSPAGSDKQPVLYRLTFDNLQDY
jgi:hypothetical protein